MIDIVLEHGLEFVFGVSTLVLGIIAYRQSRLEHFVEVEGILGSDRKATLFTRREPMLVALSDMYKKAESGDIIWGQCVGCDDYTSSVRNVVLEAAGRGVGWRIIVNTYSPTLAEFRSIFDPIRAAHIVEAGDNAIRLQGLSDKQVMISIPELTSYTGVLIKDPNVVKALRAWFDQRFEAHETKAEPSEVTYDGG